jgi:hypothetical protein
MGRESAFYIPRLRLWFAGRLGPRLSSQARSNHPVLHTSQEFSPRLSVSRDVFPLEISRLTRAVSFPLGEVCQQKIGAHAARMRRIVRTLMLTA